MLLLSQLLKTGMLLGSPLCSFHVKHETEGQNAITIHSLLFLLLILLLCECK